MIIASLVAAWVSSFAARVAPKPFISVAANPLWTPKTYLKSGTALSVVSSQ